MQLPRRILQHFLVYSRISVLILIYESLTKSVFDSVENEFFLLQYAFMVRLISHEMSNVPSYIYAPLLIFSLTPNAAVTASRSNVYL